MSRQTNRLNLITEFNPKSPISEAYRTLRTNIQFSSIDKPMKILSSMSASEGEGKTTTTTNLATAYAQEGKRVLLIDADLRKPSLHRIFAQSNRVGLTSVIVNQLNHIEAISETFIPNLYLLTSGPVPPNPSELLSSQKMSQFLAEMRGIYDVIFIDSPPTLAVTDSLIIAAMCDGVLLVVHAGKSKKELVMKAQSRLEHVKANVLGVVLNNKKRVSGDNDFYYGIEEKSEQ